MNHIIASIQMMTLKPNYLRVFLRAYFLMAIVTAVGVAIMHYQHGTGLLQSAKSFCYIVAVIGTPMAFVVGVGFVPRELSYDTSGFSRRTLLRGRQSFTWDKLVAFGPGRSVYLLKFEGNATLQISGWGYRKQEWRDFKNFLDANFPEKKCSAWVGTLPLTGKR